jgi:hypothetical protein
MATAPSLETSLAPDTTAQQDITTAGQRRINLIWETTQSAVAITVILANVVAALWMVMHRVPFSDYPPILGYAMFLIVGFYFSRTNHAAIGGVGPQMTTPYIGR